MTAPIDITLALPAYNEESNIAQVIEASSAALNKIDIPWEILVIDNHSSDATPEIVRQLAEKEPRIRLIRHSENKLYSGSCATAISEARGKYLAIMDSDGQFVASDIPLFLTRLEAGANFVLGWRRTRHDPLSRIVFSRIFNLLGRFWLGSTVHDLNCGIRVFDRAFMAVAGIKHRINLANPELFVRGRIAGMKCDEVEVEHHERKGGATSHNFRKSVQLFIDVNKHFLELSKELRSRERGTQVPREPQSGGRAPWQRSRGPE